MSTHSPVTWQSSLTSRLFLQGCCFSRTEGPNSPYPGGVPSSSARAINAPAASSQTGDSSVTSPTSPGNRPHGHHHHRPLSQQINKPLRRHEWVSRNRTWTRDSLNKERAEFFDTRVTGRPEIWQTLHSALEVLWDADIASNQAETSTIGGEEEQPSVALATAQTMLLAADITLPSGDLAQGVYDAFGNYYPLPECIVADPVNIGHEQGHTSVTDSKLVLTGLEVSAGDDDLDDDEAERRREEKGKAVLNLETQITVRARLSENSHDVIVTLGKDETVRSLARKISDEAHVCPDTFCHH